jgi:hypothetical protein
MEEPGMRNPSTRQPVIKRGGFAKDRRTGMVYQITEIGGRDMMVRPAYKSDGIWVAPEHLQAVQDPHTWTVRHLLLALLALAFSAWIAYGNFQDLTDHGLGASDAVWESAFPSGAFVLLCLSHLLGLVRS